MLVEILIAVAILGGLGIIFGAVLAAASKVFYVETDPRLEKLNECLPGANCGGCGYAGCGGYAEAVLNGEAPIGKCASGGNECAQAMAEIMGVEAAEVTRKVALVRCSGEKTYDKQGNLVSGAKVKAEYAHQTLCVDRLVTITDTDPERLRRRQVRQGPRIFKRTDSDAQFHREKPSTYAVQTFIYRV